MNACALNKYQYHNQNEHSLCCVVLCCKYSGRNKENK